MIACSCLHLAQQGIDEITVLTSGSTDPTRSGLRSLAAGGAPIVVVDEPAGLFHHAAITTMLLHLAMDRGADWVVPFDADEFMLPADPALTLRDVIAAWSASGEAGTRRLQVRNFVVPPDTSRFAPDTLERSLVAAIPQPTNTLADTIEAVRIGATPFACAPFPSKVVVAREAGLWVYAGAHEALGLGHPPVPTDDAFIAHVPFRDRESLERRGAYAATIRGLGYRPEHAWQSRLVEEADATPDALDRAGWWRLNALAEADLPNAGGVFERDARLADHAKGLRSAFSEIAAAAEASDAPSALPHAEIDSASVLRAGIAASRAAECLLASERELRWTVDLQAAEAHQQALSAQHAVAEAQARISALELHAAATDANAVRDTAYWRDRALHAESVRAELEGSRSWRLAGTLRRSAGRFRRPPGDRPAD